MKIFNWFKEKPLKSNHINYEKDTYWYTNLSPSANIGGYESEAYNALIKDGYDPMFYLGDLHSGKFKDKVEEKKKLFWIPGEGTDASEIKIASGGDGTIPVKVDVILECKGAIWHSLNSPQNNMHDVVKVLKNYYNLLRTDDSKLLIDFGIPSFVRKMFYAYIKLLCPSDKVRKKEVNMHFMSEDTTYYYFIEIYYFNSFLNYNYI